MRITVLGWYGTETIGDRAILAGIFKIFGDFLPEFSIQLGSLYPDFTQRTLIEDGLFYKMCSGQKLKCLNIFNSLNVSELKTAIFKSDLVVIGGGPLMDLPQMYMLKYALKFSKKKRIQTIVFGCGWGPLKSTEYKKIASSIIKLSDLSIFRDAISLNEFIKYSGEKLNNSQKYHSAIDPAFFCADYYKNIDDTRTSEPYIAINFRDITNDQYGGCGKNNLMVFEKIVRNLLENYDLPIRLVPMHTFFVGGDDRSLLNQISFLINNPRISVLNNPPTLTEVMNVYKNAYFCIGMRFHSIVLQTVLNGKNIMLDYTDPKKGKIIGLLEELKVPIQKGERYFSLINLENEDIIFTEPKKFTIEEGFIASNRDKYIKNLQHIIGNV